MADERAPRRRPRMPGRTRFKRGSVVCAIVAVAAVVLSWLTLSAPTAPVARAAEATPACAGVDPTTETGLIGAYRNAGTYPARQSNSAQGTPASVAVSIAPIAFTGPGQSSTLPVGPCQTIYRFVFPHIRTRHATESPFKYAEVDWNTEGLPRGPQNSFLSPHFDFHFYLRQKSWVDGRVHYSVDEVNHHPVLLYGSYDGRILFVEASVTEYNLQDAVQAPSHTLSYVYRQPRNYEQRSWPTRFTITYHPRTGGFTAAFTDIRTH